MYVEANVLHDDFDTVGMAYGQCVLPRMGSERKFKMLRDLF